MSLSLTLAVWFLAFGALAVLTFRRSVWAVGLYMLTFFACPPLWWWGRPVADYRWNLYGGIALLAAVACSRLLGKASVEDAQTPEGRRLGWLAVLLLVNATLVHLLLASSAVSTDSYLKLAKFVLLFVLIINAVRTRADLRLLLVMLVVGAGYIGFEVTLRDAGSIEGNRLEGAGAPGATDANHCASLMVTILPLAGMLFMIGRRWEKLLALALTPLILNVILLCNSRGAFMAAIASGILLFVAAPSETRRKAAKVLALGAVAAWLLLGDPRIVERFMTAFAGEEDRDSSAAGRLLFWQAGLAMVADRPLGSGGDGFKKVHGTKYLAKIGIHEDVRAVHNGYINEACEWGIQGLILRLAFLGSAFLCVWRAARLYSRAGDETMGLLGAGIAASMTAFAVTSCFGDVLDAEWGYWMVAIAAIYWRLATSEDARCATTHRAESITPGGLATPAPSI